MSDVTEADRTAAREIADRVRGMWTDRDELVVAAELGLAAGRASLSADAAELRARIERLTAALKPFAELGERLTCCMHVPRPTDGDLLRAAALLAPEARSP